MTVQELINALNSIENKNLPVIIEYDGMFYHVEMAKDALLWSADKGINITEYYEKEVKDRYYPYPHSEDYPCVVVGHKKEYVRDDIPQIS